MSYVSPLSSKMIVIDDSNFAKYARDFTASDGNDRLRGHIPRDWDATPQGSLGPFAAAFDLPLIPRDEWPERIEEMERTKSSLSHVRRQAQLKSQDQDGTNYCWIHAVVSAMRLIRALNGQPDIGISAASGGAIIKSYRNQGGWCGQALEYIVEHGVCSTEYWPENAIQKKYDNEESRANRALHKVPEWYDLARRNFDQAMTLVLMRIPISAGFNWWGHAICLMAPVLLGPKKFGIKIWNSWGDDWSDQGESVLAESKATPDDAVAPRVVSPSVT